MSPPINKSSRWLILTPIALLLGILVGMVVMPRTVDAQSWPACEYDTCQYDGDLRLTICEDMRQDPRFPSNCRMRQGQCLESGCELVLH